MTHDEIYQERVDRDARNYPSKSQLRRIEKIKENSPMTHDELLYELRPCDADDCGCPKAHRFSKALRAVVELCNEWETKGSYCLPIGDVIKAIEKELG